MIELKQDVKHMRDTLDQKNKHIEKLEKNKSILKDLYVMEIIHENVNVINH